jgi:hypothetical protein
VIEDRPARSASTVIESDEQIVEINNGCICCTMAERSADPRSLKDARAARSRIRPRDHRDHRMADRRWRDLLERTSALPADSIATVVDEALTAQLD